MPSVSLNRCSHTRDEPRLANDCLGLVQLTVSIMVPNYEQNMIKLYIKHFF